MDETSTASQSNSSSQPEGVLEQGWRRNLRHRIDDASSLCTRYKDLISTTDTAIKFLLTIAAIVIAISQFQVQKGQAQIQKSSLDIQERQNLIQEQQRTIQANLADIAYQREQPTWVFRLGFREPLVAGGLEMLISNEGESVSQAGFHPQPFLLHTEYKGAGDNRYCLQRLTPIPAGAGLSVSQTRSPKGIWGTIGLDGVGGYFGGGEELRELRKNLAKFESVTAVVAVFGEYDNRLGHHRLEGNFVSFHGSSRMEIMDAMRFRMLIPFSKATKPTLADIRAGEFVISEETQRQLKRCPIWDT